jgi:hypothetical protein
MTPPARPSNNYAIFFANCDLDMAHVAMAGWCDQSQAVQNSDQKVGI